MLGGALKVTTSALAFFASQAGPAKAGQEDRPMHAVIRTYSGIGAKELFDLLERRKSDVESLIRSVKGLVSYSLVRTSDGGVTITVCHDKAGSDDSVQKAKDWIAKNGSEIGASAPTVSEGAAILQLK
jgi:hypothetical protein